MWAPGRVWYISAIPASPSVLGARTRSTSLSAPSISIARLGLEAISDATDRSQMARVRRLLLDIAPQPDDEVIDGAGVGILVHSPNLFQHGFPRYGLALMLDQVAKQVRLHEVQLHRAVSPVHLEPFELDDLPRDQT